MQNDDQIIQAREIVKAKLGLYIHSAVYVLVNVGLVATNLGTNPKRLWFQWPLMGWGAGLALHAALVLVCAEGGSIQKRMIERELANEN